MTEDTTSGCPTWDELAIDARLDLILSDFMPFHWLNERCLVTLAAVRDDPARWAVIQQQARTRGVDRWELEAAVGFVLTIIRRAEEREESWQHLLATAESRTGPAHPIPRSGDWHRDARTPEEVPAWQKC